MQYKCQTCGFSVFNRRYPKCESCGIELAEGIALSKSELKALLGSEAEAARLAWRERQKAASQSAPDGDAGAAVIGASIAASSGDF